MGIPACLWRRTGEIYKGNREFAELVGVDEYMLRDVSVLDVGSFFRDTKTGFSGSIMHLRAYG
jgi:hypothetical protein